MLVGISCACVSDRRHRWNAAVIWIRFRCESVDRKIAFGFFGFGNSNGDGVNSNSYINFRTAYVTLWNRRFVYGRANDCIENINEWTWMNQPTGSGSKMHGSNTFASRSFLTEIVCKEENIKIAVCYCYACSLALQLYLCLCVYAIAAATKSVIVRTKSERQRRRLGGIAVVAKRNTMFFFSFLFLLFLAQNSSRVFDSSRNSFLPSVFSQTKILFPHF